MQYIITFLDKHTEETKGVIEVSLGNLKDAIKVATDNCPDGCYYHIFEPKRSA